MPRGRHSHGRTHAFFNDENGHGVVEYALLAAVLSGSILAGYAIFGDRVPPMLGSGRVGQDYSQVETPAPPPAAPEVATPPLIEPPSQTEPAPDLVVPVPDPLDLVPALPPAPLTYIGPATITIAEDTAEVVPLDTRGERGSYSCGLDGTIGSRQTDMAVVYAVAPGVRLVSRPPGAIPCSLEADAIAAETVQEVHVVFADTADHSNTAAATINLQIAGCVKPGNGGGHGYDVCKTKPAPECSPPGNGGGYAHGVCKNGVDEGGNSGR